MASEPVLTPEQEIIAVVRGTMLDGRNWRKERMRWLIDNEVAPVVQRVITAAKVAIVEELMQEAEASGDHTVSYADMGCRVWILKGLCPYCGGGHEAGVCPTMKIYMEEQARDQSHF